MEEEKIKNYLVTLLEFYHKDDFPKQQKIVGMTIPKKALIIESKEDCLSRIKGICSVMGFAEFSREYDNGNKILIKLDGDD